MFMIAKIIAEKARGDLHFFLKGQFLKEHFFLNFAKNYKELKVFKHGNFPNEIFGVGPGENKRWIKMKSIRASTRFYLFS